MSLFQQADEVRAARAKPEQRIVLTEATARLDDVHWGSEVERHVRISGRDVYGKDRTASIPFQQHFRGEAAVLADEITRSGIATLRGDIQLGTKDFLASSVESGTATLDGRHDRFDLKRVLSHGLESIKGRSEDQIEAAAIAAHRSSAGAGAGR